MPHISPQALLGLHFHFGADIYLKTVELLHHQERAIESMIHSIILNTAVSVTFAAWLIMFDTITHHSLTICCGVACVP